MKLPICCLLGLAALPLIAANQPDRPKLKLDYLEETLGEPEAPKAEPVVEAPTERGTAAVAEATGTATDPAGIEAETGGKLGIALVDASGKLLLGFNRDESFPMCSTFKGPLAASIAMAAENGRFGLEGTLPLRQEDVLDYAPVVKANVKRGRLPIGDLAAAAVEVSDNSAANILLPLVGGPEGLTAFARAHGDTVTRFDRTEPTLNENAEGDPRDTTTPAAMATLMARLLFQDMPAPASAKLRGWLEASKTGGKRIRAGVPTGWKVGDKTGTCGTSFGDVAVLRSPAGNDYLLAIYLDRPTVSAASAEAAIARSARATLEMMNTVARSQPTAPTTETGAVLTKKPAGPPDVPQGR